MKTTLLSATALALILSVPAFAAPHDHGDRHGDHNGDATPAATTPDGHGHGGGRGHGGPAANPAPNPAAGGTMDGAGGGTHHRGGTGGHDNGGHDNGGHNNSGGGDNGAAMFGAGGGTHHRGGTGGRDNGSHDNGGHNNGGGANNGAAVFGAGRGTHTGHGHNSAFDAFRRAFNAPRHFHHGSYHRPSGWYAHRWSYGEFLPSIFFGRSYWIDDYSDFALNHPPPGTVWVRYGDDALLIDEDSGEVIQVVYGIFY